MPRLDRLDAPDPRRRDRRRRSPARLDRVVARVRAGGGRVLAFGHGHSLRALAARWIEQPVDEGRFFQLDTATVSTLGYERDFPVVLRWNS